MTSWLRGTAHGKPNYPLSLSRRISRRPRAPRPPPPPPRAGPPRRKRGGTMGALQPTLFDFLRRRLGRDVVVQRAGLRLGDMLVDDEPDNHVLVTAVRTGDPNAIAVVNRAVRLGGLAVDRDLSAFAGALGFRARLEETRDVEPDVQAQGQVHASIFSRLRSRSSFDVRCEPEPRTRTQKRERRRVNYSDEYLDLPRRLQRVDEGPRLAFAGLSLEVLFHLRPHFHERKGAGGLLGDDLEDVEAERRLDEFARLTGGKREGGLLARSHHLAALEVSEVAALRRAPRILRVLLGEGCEVLAGLDFLEDSCGPLTGLRLGGGVSPFGHADQDVAGVDALGLL